MTHWPDSGIGPTEVASLDGAVAGSSQTSRKRVLHVITVLGVGGVEVWLIELLKHLHERSASGCETETFDICLTGGRPADLDELATQLGATLHYIPFSRKGFLRFTKDFRRLLEERGFAAIHDHQDYSAAWHLLAGAGVLPPVRIVHVHNPPVRLRINTSTSFKRALFHIAQRIVGRLATHVLGTSRQVLGEYGFEPSRFPRQSIRLLHCGFDVRQFTTPADEANASVCAEFGWSPGSRICLFVGRLEGFDPLNPDWNHKNPEFALEVARESMHQRPDMRFLVAGAGDRMRALLESRVDAWGLGDAIRFAGRRLDVPRLMSASHACLFPSLEEGLGMVAVEAQASGLQVLASDTVPREAAVVPGLVTFLPLGAGVPAWAAELNRVIDLPRFDMQTASDIVRTSPFAIENSYAALHQIYSGAG